MTEQQSSGGEGNAPIVRDQAIASDRHSEPDQRGLSWPAMLGLIGLAFLLAGVIAWRLVRPFFAHG